MAARNPIANLAEDLRKHEKIRLLALACNRMRRSGRGRGPFSKRSSQPHRPEAHPHRPYTPKTNGNAERFIQSALREWADAQPYTHSDRRTAAEQPRWRHRYNWHRPHGSLDARTPISRLGMPEELP
jgi:transposase InsO family protein